jgi:DNA-binding MarR family transcriptional regulator
MRADTAGDMRRPAPSRLMAGDPAGARRGRRRRRTDPRIAEAEQAFFDHNLTYSIMVLANLIGRNTSRHALAGAPVNLNEWRALRMIRMFAPICAADIIDLLGLDKTTVSRAITRLHELGLARLSANSSDRRQTLIRLTAAGTRLHDRLLPKDQGNDASFEQALTPVELKQFLRVMQKLRPHALELLQDL